MELLELKTTARFHNTRSEPLKIVRVSARSVGMEGRLQIGESSEKSHHDVVPAGAGAVDLDCGSKSTSCCGESATGPQLQLCLCAPSFLRRGIEEQLEHLDQPHETSTLSSL
jgi:hypothetical protein